MDDKIVVSHKRKNRELILRPEPAGMGGILMAALKHIVSKGKTYIKVALLVAAGILAAMLMYHTAINIFPYEIILDDETLCYVRGKDAVEETYSKIMDHYTPEGTELKAVNIGERISYERREYTQIESHKVITPDAAAKVLLKAFREAEPPVELRIASASYKLAKYVPEPNYVKDDTLIAGESEVEKKGKNGKQKVITTYISVNGKIISKSITGHEIVDKGKPATVRRGTLGLPKGADWKTFNGDPVFKNGKELVTTAMKYRGAPYRYGGTSLKTGIDCVQFVRQMYAKYGISLPNSHSGLQHSGKAVSYKKAKKGDIICYNGHVGIYIGDGKMINAVHRGVSVSSVKPGRIKTVRRVVK